MEISIRATMGQYTIRKTTEHDLEKVMPLFDHSRSIMRSNGNQRQWVGGYPAEAIIREDIARGNSYVLTDGLKIAGTFAFIIGRDTTYEKIEDGAWQEDDRPYGTIHRMARSASHRGIFATAIDWCRRQTTSLRIDTHEDNAIMRHLIEAHGFTYSGIIRVADGSPRMAYQMLKTRMLCEPLSKYIMQEILPRYASFDNAHRQDHAESVINNSMMLATHYDVDPNMVYTIAAYHDTGLCKGREIHHAASKQILLADTELRKWFSESQITMMGEAVEDHRASSGREPRSLYGKIVAEADRDIDALKIVRRTVLYGMEHYSNLDKEAHWARTLAHLNDKYSEKGYMKLWIPESPNAEKLAELRHLIADKERLRKIFDQLYEAEKRHQLQ